MSMFSFNRPRLSVSTSQGLRTTIILTGNNHTQINRDNKQHCQYMPFNFFELSIFVFKIWPRVLLDLTIRYLIGAHLQL